MRVLFLYHSFYAYAGGVERVLQTLLDELPRHGIEAFVLTRRHNKSTRPEGLRRYENIVVECDEPFDTMENPMRTRVRLLKAIAGLRPDVVVFNLNWRIDLSTLVRPHCGVIATWYADRDSDSYFGGAMTYGASLDILVGGGDNVARHLIRRCPNADVRSIFFGVPVDGGLPMRPVHDEIRLAYVGRLDEPEKRVSDLPNILAGLKARSIRYEMAIAGAGAEESTLRAAFARLELPVNFLGEISPPEVQVLLAESDVLLITSNFEGGPFVLMEAMAEGCIPVASQCGGLVPELVHDGRTGFTFPVGDVEAAAGHIETLSRDRELLEQLSRDVRIAVRPYDVNKTVARWVDMIHELAERKPADWSVTARLDLWRRYVMQGAMAQLVTLRKYQGSHANG